MASMRSVDSMLGSSVDDDGPQLHGSPSGHMTMSTLRGQLQSGGGVMGAMPSPRRPGNRSTTESLDASPDVHPFAGVAGSTYGSSPSANPMAPSHDGARAFVAARASLDGATAHNTSDLAPQYMGVRQVIRALGNGPVVRPWLDAAIDACSHMVNLRLVIGQYRNVRVARQRSRPDAALQQAFSRDVVALQRYCLLLAYAAFLDRMPSADIGAACFSRWVASMASVKASPARLCGLTLLLLQFAAGCGGYATSALCKVMLRCFVEAHNSIMQDGLPTPPASICIRRRRWRRQRATPCMP